jgi:hypothetical protein
MELSAVHAMLIRPARKQFSNTGVSLGERVVRFAELGVEAPLEFGQNLTQQLARELALPADGSVDRAFDTIVQCRHCNPRSLVLGNPTTAHVPSLDLPPQHHLLEERAHHDGRGFLALDAAFVLDLGLARADFQ